MKKIFIIGIFILIKSISIAQTDANIKYKGITIYIDYPDKPTFVSHQQLDSLINGVNYKEVGVERSFRNYWYEQTRRNIDITHDIFYYTAPKNTTYYDSISWQAGILLWKDALEFVIKNNPDYNWNLLSTNSSNSSLKSVMIISSAWGPAGVGAAHGPNWTLSNGKVIEHIYCSVLKAPWDNSINMFMTLHESGHAIFNLPDTYDTDYDSGGTSFYTLMSGGKNDVEPVGGPFRVQHNWGYLLEPVVGTHSITLIADGDSVLVFRNIHDSLEYFTVEARKQSSIGNSLFPAKLGLLIWHTDSKVNSSNTLQDRTPLKHYRNSIVQADGLFELEASIDNKANIGDIYLPGSSFKDSTLPNTKWWDKTQSNIELSNIQLIGANEIKFNITVPPPHLDHYPEIPQKNWSLIHATPSQAGYNGAKAFDGDVNTYYHVPWGNSNLRPHSIVIDLGKVYSINEFYYTANKNNSPPWEGRIQDYKIFISTDTLNWGNEVATGTFFETGIKQYVLFAIKIGRYLKLDAINSFNKDVRTSIAEINLRGFESSSSEVQLNNFKLAYRLYPNPSKGDLIIESNDEYTNENYFISDITSRIVQQGKLEGNNTKVDLSNLSCGVYFIQIDGVNEPKNKIVRY